MSTRSSSSSSREELMSLGKSCQHQFCNLVDFLPFDCPACKQPFCQEHFLPSAHLCAAPLPPSMVDRIAPQCPMCNEVVSYPPGGQQDPNAAVERHILSGTCSAMEGGAARKKAELKRKKQAGKVCYRGGCTKVIIAPMKCDQCKHIFCPPHRHETSHSCKATPTSSGANTPAPSTSRSRSTTPGVKTPLSRLVSSAPSSSFASSASKPLASPVAAVQAAGPQLEARAAAAAAAMKRAGQDVKVPFVKTKTEKRANAETQSTIKALKARHDKGLLTKAEELKYAELVGKAESGRRKGEKNDKDCIIS